MKVNVKKEKGMKELGRFVANKIGSIERNKATVITLSGDLGTGKTTFVKGLAKELGVEEITSPTFVIMKKYPIEKPIFDFLYHIDCYRITQKISFKDLGIENDLENKKVLIVIEWPKYLKKRPKDVLDFKFSITENKEEREVFIPDKIGLIKKDY